MQYWENISKKQLLTIGDDRIYVLSNFASYLHKEVVDDLRVKLKGALEIPFHFIDRIQFCEDRLEIIINYSKGSSVTLNMLDDQSMNELLTKFTNLFPQSELLVYTPTLKESGKKLFAALMVLTLAYIFCLIVSLLEFDPSGYSNIKSVSILTLLRAIGLLGPFYLSLIYSLFAVFIVFRLRKIARSPTVIKVIKINGAPIDKEDSSIADIFQ